MAPLSAATMLPVHDHFFAEPLTGAGGTFLLGARLFDGYHHDWRCMGECWHCGGAHTPYPDTPALHCIYCSHGECPGCNAYNSYA